MKQAPNIWNLPDLIESTLHTQAVLPNGDIVPSRPLGLYSFKHRLKCAWLVFTGKADVVIWPE